MRRLLSFSVLLAALVSVVIGGAAHAAPVPVTVRVALYPYVPGPYAVFALLAREFQKRNEGVTLELVEVDPSKDYYDDGLTSLKADVYEIDSILLAEMIPKVAPLNLSLADFTAEARDAVTRDGIVYAVPHWLCGNFIFFRNGDDALRDAATWIDLLKVISTRNKPLLVDMFGRLTLGEWYLTLLADRIGVDAAQKAVLASSQPDADVVSELKQILSACPTGYCRSRTYHERTGFYARAFARGEARAYVGYSETLHYALTELSSNCGLGTSCLAPDEIAVRRLPTMQGTLSEGIGWVDGLALSKDATGATRDAALKFIEFATSADGYRAALQPIHGEGPRYLLPARTGIQPDGAPLYPDLLAAQAGRKTGTAPGLSAGLRRLSVKLNCLLPVDRTDTKSQGACQTP